MGYARAAMLDEASMLDNLSPKDVFGDTPSTIRTVSSTIKGGSSTISEGSSTISPTGKDQDRDEFGRLIAKLFHLPFVDSIQALDPKLLASLE